MTKMGAAIIDRKKNLVEFRVFARDKKDISVVIKDGDRKTVFPMAEEQPHLYSTVIRGEGPNLLYKFQVDGREYPDPYAHYQPGGVHGYSQLIDHEAYQWRDSHYRGIKPQELIIMEIHVGTFTRAGTFRAAVEKLDYLSELGITAVELMPVAQTPGRWNWGYDGTNLFSVNHNYGTPGDLKHLVDCCHAKNIAVILDVVYNHFGPEGNYLHAYGPYFTDKHTTPWGPAVNFDDRYSEYTRKMVLDSVRHWVENYHIDGFRLDAVHAIKDNSPIHILQEISMAAKNMSRINNREIVLIAESDENDARLISSLDEGGYGMDAQWLDDFHHCLHTVLTGEREGYYMDYGPVEDFKKVFKNYLYTGQYSKFWEKERGTDASVHPGRQFVVAVQNHDQVGNRARGDRLSTLVEFPYLKAAAGLVFFSAYLPLFFMGEEYGEQRPFMFFTDYQDPELQKAVSRGRREEFKEFTWENVPDPQGESTFYESKLTPQSQWDELNSFLFKFYQDLIKLRKSHPVLKTLDKDALEVETDPKTKLVKVIRRNQELELTCLFNLGTSQANTGRQQGRLIFNSESELYGGKGEGEMELLSKGQMVVYESCLS